MDQSSLELLFQLIHVLANHELHGALDCILRHYNHAGFIIKEIHADSEFDPVKEELVDKMDIDFVPHAQGGTCQES